MLGRVMFSASVLRPGFEWLDNRLRDFQPGEETAFSVQASRASRQQLVPEATCVALQTCRRHVSKSSVVVDQQVF